MLVAGGLFAQPERIKLEQDIQKKVDRISYWAESNSDTKYDSLDKANQNLSNYLLTVTKSIPASLGWKFNIKQLTTATSPDGLLRIYSWDTWTGGTMHYFQNVVQYRVGNKVNSTGIEDKDGDGDAGYYYENIYLLKKGDKSYYLVNYKGIYSSKDISEGLRVFNFQNGQLLANTKLIKTLSGLHNSIEYSYDFFSIVDWKVRPSILYDSVKKEIKIPLVDESGRVTKRFITYKFTGQYFEKVKS